MAEMAVGSFVCPVCKEIKLGRNENELERRVIQHFQLKHPVLWKDMKRGEVVRAGGERECVP